MKLALSWIHDWYQLLRAVYNPGIKRHEPIHVLGCANCGQASGDIREDQHAWDGWIIAPVHICPDCTETGKAQLPDGVPYPRQLQDRRRKDYLNKLQQVKNGGNRQ